MTEFAFTPQVILECLEMWSYSEFRQWMVLSIFMTFLLVNLCYGADETLGNSKPTQIPSGYHKEEEEVVKGEGKFKNLTPFRPKFKKPPQQDPKVEKPPIVLKPAPFPDKPRLPPHARIPTSEKPPKSFAAEEPLPLPEITSEKRFCFRRVCLPSPIPKPKPRPRPRPLPRRRPLPRPRPRPPPRRRPRPPSTFSSSP